MASSATASYFASHPHGQGALAQVHGYRSAFLVAAAVAVACSPFALVFVRTARLSHTRPHSTFQYVIRQTTQVRRGRVVRQINETLEGA